VAVALFDTNCTAALATAVLFGVTDRLRASVARNATATVLADEPPHGCSEAFAVLRGIEIVRPAGERWTVIRVTELVVFVGR
jgi:hypothetical protein